MTTSRTDRTTVRAGRPAKINRDDVVTAALAIANEQGLSQLSLRSVADRLSVTPAALYRLVDGPLDLVAMVIESAVDDAVSAVPEVLPVGWRPLLAGGARLLHQVLLEHPMLVEAYQQRLVVSSKARPLIAHSLAELGAAGLDAENVVDAYATVQAFVVGYVALEHRRQGLSATGDSPWGGAITLDLRLSKAFQRHYFAPDRFEKALSVVLDGIQARIDMAGTDT